MLAGRDRDDVGRAQPAVRLVVRRRERLLEPRRAVLGHAARKRGDGLLRIAAVAHAPPGMGVDHEPHLRADRGAHEPHGLQVLLRAERGSHLVGREPHRRDGRRLLGEPLGRHVHPGAAVELDAVPLAPADELREGAALVPRRQVNERDLDRAVRLRGLQVAGEHHLRPLERVAADEEMADHLPYLRRRALVRRPGRVADQPVVRGHPDKHGVPLDDRPLAAVEGKPERLRERVRHQERLDLGDLHGGLCRSVISSARM